MRLPIPLDDDLAEVAARLRQSTVEVRTLRGGRATGHGSGIVWDADRVIVTNAHVAQGARATVTLADGRALDASSSVLLPHGFRDGESCAPPPL